ncbi:glycosyltransferase family 52 [Acinetobacter indicus]|uniref:glycosyltransferase family 52 n=1 Tax=Acinetobacter indicus TaxID=756892 RepID=UPI0014448AFA|nr:glycosyltransferase family 52 [Acinetobacter indicus]
MVCNREKSLILCVTPLQLLIAEKIIISNTNEVFDLVVIALQDNEKYRYYFERVRKKCDKSLFVIRKQREITCLLKLILGMVKNNFKKNYDSVYLASIDSRLWQFIISKNSKANIYTFDDGIANIIPNGHYYLDDQQECYKKIIWKMLGVKYFRQDIRKKSKLHYTIYENIPNIIQNTKYIHLTHKGNYVHRGVSQFQGIDTIKIFVGQPLYEVNPKYSQDYILNVIEKIKVDYYFPHPRELNLKKGNFRIIDTGEIFEDFVSNFLLENPNANLEVISFISSALINIASLDRVEVSYIFDKELFDLYQDFYEMVGLNFSIECKKYE